MMLEEPEDVLPFGGLQAVVLGPLERAGCKGANRRMTAGGMELC